MTALDMIREGYTDRTISISGNNFAFDPVLFVLLLLFGFLAAGLLKTIRIPQTTVDSTPNSLSVEGREIINDANTARLFELESELAATKEKLARFTQTMSSTFAQLSGGLAIFDADKSLHLFNPALSDLLDLEPVWLAGRPSIADFIGKLREKRLLPEKKNFLEWRRLLTDLGETSQQSNYEDEWVIPDGRIFRVTAQPHPRGAVAFQFEDVSAKIAIDRRHHLESITSNAILNNISSAVMIVHPCGSVKFANAALSYLIGLDDVNILLKQGPAIEASGGISNNETERFWLKLKTYVSASGHRTSWEQQVVMGGTDNVFACVSALPDDTTLVVIRTEAKYAIEKLSNYSDELQDSRDPLGFDMLENLLRQRNISIDCNGFDIANVGQVNAVKLRRVLWYLTIGVSDHCRAGGKISLTSVVEGQLTRLSCFVAKWDWLDNDKENLATKILKQLIEQPDIENQWQYNFEADGFTVSFKAPLLLQHSDSTSL